MLSEGTITKQLIINMEYELSEQFTHSIENIAQQLYGAMYKEVKKAIKLEGQDYQTGYEQGVAAGKKKVLENFPMWKIAPKDDYIRESVLAGAGEFGMRVLYRGQLIKEGWKYIPIKSLKVLPVEVIDKNDE